MFSVKELRDALERAEKAKQTLELNCTSNEFVEGIINNESCLTELSSIIGVSLNKDLMLELLGNITLQYGGTAVESSSKISSDEMHNRVGVTKPQFKPVGCVTRARVSTLQPVLNFSSVKNTYTIGVNSEDERVNEFTLVDLYKHFNDPSNLKFDRLLKLGVNVISFQGFPSRVKGANLNRELTDYVNCKVDNGGYCMSNFDKNKVGQTTHYARIVELVKAFLAVLTNLGYNDDLYEFVSSKIINASDSNPIYKFMYFCDNGKKHGTDDVIILRVGTKDQIVLSTELVSEKYKTSFKPREVAYMFMFSCIEEITTKYNLGSSIDLLKFVRFYGWHDYTINKDKDYFNTNDTGVTVTNSSVPVEGSSRPLSFKLSNLNASNFKWESYRKCENNIDSKHRIIALKVNINGHEYIVRPEDLLHRKQNSSYFNTLTLLSVIFDILLNEGVSQNDIFNYSYNYRLLSPEGINPAGTPKPESGNYVLLSDGGFYNVSWYLCWADIPKFFEKLFKLKSIPLTKSSIEFCFKN